MLEDTNNHNEKLLKTKFTENNDNSDVENE